MLLSKKRKPENWLAQVEEVQRRSQRGKKHRRAALLRGKEQLSRKRQREARRLRALKLKRLNDIVKSGRFRVV